MMMQDEQLKRLRAAGVMALLPGDLPLQRILEIGDALLASPLLALEIGAGEHQAQIVADLRQRAGKEMLIGMGGVTDQAMLETAVSAGAQFIHSPYFLRELWADCRQLNLLYMPEVMSINAAYAVQSAGCQAVRLTTGGPQGPGFVRNFCQVLPDLDLIVGGDITTRTLVDYAQCGITAVAVADALMADVQQPMATTISNARSLAHAWQIARQKIN